MRHLFLKLKVTEWKGDKKDITIKTEMLQKNFPIKKKPSNFYKPKKKIVTTNTLYLLHIKK